MPLLSTFGAASARGFGNLSGIEVPIDDLFNTVSFLSHFDGTNNGVNNSFDDSSSSNHTITANGDVTQGSFGPFARPDGEWAVSFDGSADFIEGPSVDLLGSGAFTVECWVNIPSKTTASNFTDAFLAQYQSNGNLIIGSKLNVVRVWMGGSEVTVGSVGIVGNGWHHIALTRNSSNSVRLFVDGSADGAAFTNSTDFSQNLENFEIGSWDNGANSALNGNISNLRVVKGTAVYDPSVSTITVPTASLAAITNTSLLTCQSNRFVDNSASAHTITPSGNAAVSAFGPFLTSDVYDAGVNGASAYFDGDGDKLTAATSSDFAVGSGDFTLSVWVYLTSDIDDNGMIAGYYETANNQRSYAIYLESITKNFAMVFSTDGTFQSGNVFASSVDADDNLNQWLHLTMKKSGTNATLYLNGTAIKTTSSAPATPYTPTSGNFSVGTFNTSQFVAGYISDVKLVNGTATTPTAGGPTSVASDTTNTKLLLNMADGQAIDSAAQHNLTLFGDAKISNTQSKFGGTSLALDGTGDFAIAQGFNDLSGPFTIECFARADDTTNAFLWCVGVYKIELGINGNDLRIYRSSGYTNFFTGGEFTVNNWHHVALVRDTSNVIKLYLNGTASGTTVTDSTTYAAGEGLFIGGEYASATSINHGWDGYIDDFRVSNTARYTSSFTPPTEPFADKGQ